MNERRIRAENECYSLNHSLSQYHYVTYGLIYNELQICFQNDNNKNYLDLIGALEVLQIIKVLEEKIHSFCSIYYYSGSSSSRSILSFKDFENDILHMLRIYGVPTIYNVIQKYNIDEDPNEIEIDSASDNDDNNDNNEDKSNNHSILDSTKIEYPQSFMDYGVGQLNKHPAVARLFHGFSWNSSWISSSSLPSSSDIMEHYFQFIQESSNKNEISLFYFKNYLSEKLLSSNNINNNMNNNNYSSSSFELIHVGIIIKDNFQEEYILAQHLKCLRSNLSTSSSSSSSSMDIDDIVGEKFKYLYGTKPSSHSSTTSSTLEEENQIITSGDLKNCIPWFAEGDYLDNKKVGNWGERLVYNYLLSVGMEVEWVNRERESTAPYDMILRRKNSSIIRSSFIEVKSTKSSDRNQFEVSVDEWNFLTKDPKPDYVIYRVYNACSNNAHIMIVTNIESKIKRGKINLLFQLVE